ncbi:Uncharacterized protein DBV15_03070 [Temnothorax longispinosus]|uniref:Neurotransmitter-gated ion-channel ligand-binding domain-containing protein n=1 Tax=Temnothorax longispinosus TaxID=300112 RepID=A0A4V3SAL1_9HYME|nr:Uncharacterized protein DBV15_03070 [Temnothorax longispinosus]
MAILPVKLRYFVDDDSDVDTSAKRISGYPFMSVRISTQSLCGRHEKRLLNHLLANYNTLERPVANESEPLEVKFGITLQQIIDVAQYALSSALVPLDEKNQILTTNAWLKLREDRHVECYSLSQHH